MSRFSRLSKYVCLGLIAAGPAVAWSTELTPNSDCRTFMVAHGYLQMGKLFYPAPGSEGYGEVTFEFTDGAVKTARVFADVLTLPQVHSDGSFSIKVKFQDEFSDDEKITWVVDARFEPTARALVYNVTERGVLAGGDGRLWQNAYFGAGLAKSEASFATGRIDIKSGNGVLCGLDG